MREVARILCCGKECVRPEDCWSAKNQFADHHKVKLLTEALDRQAAAQRERDEKIADSLYQYQWRKDEYIYSGNVGDAIRNAP